METFKKILHALLYPYIAIVVLLVPISAVLLVCAFVLWSSDDISSIVTYVISAYTLTVICFRVPRMIGFFKDLKENNRYIVRFQSDAKLRVNASLYSSLAFNTAYAVFQLCLGFYHRSVWFFSLSAYYILLAVMRFFLLRYTRTHNARDDMRTELHRYRFCGVILMLMNLALAVIVIYITYQIRTFSHHEITTIAMAAYTFTTFTLAIINVIKYRKYESPIFSAAKAISFASALVSMLTLENAMLGAFGEAGQEQFKSLMSGLTGIGVVSIVLIMAICMIVKATKELKKLENNRS